MKTLYLTLFALTVMVACNTVDKEKLGANSQQQIDEDTTTFTRIEWVDSVQHYGKITEGQKLQVAFRFRNVGDKPLVIYNVRPSCGCTVADPPKEPLAPGAEGKIEAIFNSSGRLGQNHKELFITANTKGGKDHTVKFDVEVTK